MSSVRPVPETVELDGEDAWHTLRRHGVWPLLRSAFVRFRYGDGFSHARAFGLQLALAVVPLVIAGAGLTAELGATRVAQVVAQTVVAVSPGGSDELVQDTLDASTSADRGDEGAGEDDRREEVGEVALVLGLLTAFAATTSAFAQLERGANRVYGTSRDRPATTKYLRAAMLAVAAGVPLALGLVCIVAGQPLGTAVQEVYAAGDAIETVWDVVRWPVGLVLLTVAVTLLFRFAPRRRQPGVTWLACGAAATVLGWLIASSLLALYVVASGSFGDTYGPLTAVMALLVWANLTGIALLGGVAVAAQLEALRVGLPDPLQPDADGDGVVDGDES